ncbi:hypothetical protein A2U01_0084556, partial [Trifolium medium]|nr:hypothetical protein [Trifolium medium]
AGKDGALRQQGLRNWRASVICASRRKDGASRQAVRFLHQDVRSMARRAASSGALRSFILHHARRVEQLARRAGAISI